MKVNLLAFQKISKHHFLRNIEKSFQEITPKGPEPHHFFPFFNISTNMVARGRIGQNPVFFFSFGLKNWKKVENLFFRSSSLDYNTAMDTHFVMINLLWFKCPWPLTKTIFHKIKQNTIFCNIKPYLQDLYIPKHGQDTFH